MGLRAAGLAGVLLALAGGSQGHAAHPGLNGDIVLVRIESASTPSGVPPVSHALYTVASDGSEETMLADVPAYDPEWSPDGARIAFWADADPATGFVPAEQELFVVDADGTDVRRLTANARPDRSPTWSPDGAQLAFLRDSSVWVMDVERGRERQVARGAESVAWSPDGRWLALTRGADGSIELVRPDGTGRRRIARSSHYAGSRGFGEAVDWTPGGRIVYVNSAAQLATMTPAGTGRRRVTRLTSGYEPAWSPDGRWVVVRSWRSDGLDLFSADGSRRRVLTRPVDPMHDEDPDWQPVCAIPGTPTGDSVVGSGQADVICGREGADRVDGRDGLDRIFGGAGNDVIVVVDGRFDVVGCGAGRDTVRADRVDLVGVDCERVRRV